MSGLAMGWVLQAAMLASGADSYEAAVQAAKDNGQPIVVLVGADWCPGCVTMKNSTMPAMARAGQLKGVRYVTVNYDQNPTLARRLMQGNTIPQLIVFSQTEKGWHREQLTGATGTGSVQGLIQRAIAVQIPPAKPDTKAVVEAAPADKSSGN